MIADERGVTDMGVRVVRFDKRRGIDLHCFYVGAHDNGFALFVAPTRRARYVLISSGSRDVVVETSEKILSGLSRLYHSQQT